MTEVILNDSHGHFISNAFVECPKLPSLVLWHGKYFVRVFGTKYQETELLIATEYQVSELNKGEKE